MNKKNYLMLAILPLFYGCSGEQEAASPSPQQVQAPAQQAEAVPPAGSANGITLPPGFIATLFAEGLVTPRHIVVNGNGDVYVTIRSGQAKFRATDDEGGVMAFRDRDGDGVADMSDKFASADIDTGLALYDEHLYFASMTTIYAVPLGDQLVPAGAIEVVVDQLPVSGAGHRTKPVSIDAAGNLYTQVGSPSNSCQEQSGTPGSPGQMPCTLLEEHGGVFRFNATARNQTPADGVRYSTGHRNVVALEWNESASAVYLLMHGRDGLNQLWPQYYSPEADIERPAEEFYRLEQGDDLGWPYTYWDPVNNRRMLMPEYGGDGGILAPDNQYKTPLIGFPGHWAPNDIVFYRGDQFPARYRDGAFIAFHGAVVPRRADPGGYSVVFVPMNAAGDITGNWEFFADDFETLESTDAGVGRPTGLAVGPDGALFVVDDAGGRIWKISYTAQ